MTLTIVLACAAVLLALAPLAVALGRSGTATRFVYGASMVTSAVSLVAAAAFLVGDTAPESVTLPVGVPWLGAHLRIDALSAFFLVVSISAHELQVSLRSAMASTRPRRNACCRSIPRSSPA